MIRLLGLGLQQCSGDALSTKHEQAGKRTRARVLLGEGDYVSNCSDFGSDSGSSLSLVSGSASGSGSGSGSSDSTDSSADSTSAQ